MTTADAIVATLKACGVGRIYGLPGDSLNGLTDALRRDGGSVLSGNGDELLEVAATNLRQLIHE